MGILGPLTVGDSVVGWPRRDRVILAALAMQPGGVISADRLADALWVETPPPSWTKVVQGSVVRLRKALGAGAIETAPHGYRLRLPADDVDAARFERLLGRGRELLTLGEADRAAYVLGEALALWRGPPLADLEEWEAAQVVIGRLTELRLEAEELRLEADLRCGRHREVLAAARAQVEESPLRERRWMLLALAQYQSGRQADALRTVHEVRTLLSAELGLSPGPDVRALEEAIRRQDPSLVTATALPEPRPTCPYRGLVPYDVVDAEDFYGRDKDVAECLRRLSEVGAITVAGPSGCGKSSLVRAGVAAALRREGREVLLTAPGPHPLDSLAGLDTTREGRVLLVDQGEEVVALCSDQAERVAYLERLSEYAEHSPVVIAVRGDRLADLAAHTGFARLVERSLYLLDHMSTDDLRSAVEGPAAAAGLRLEPGLVDLLVSEVEGEPGALPLLSHALRATWERREASTLTVAGYRATGGVRGAVARSAEAVYESVPPDRRRMLRDLLLRLITPSPEGEPVRSRLPRRLVAGTDDQEDLIETLVAARLLTSDEGAIQLAHEALVRAWPRLHEWLEEDVDGQRVLRHLVVAADAWESMGRPESELYRGARLASAVEWLDQSNPSLTNVERDFLQAGLDLAAREERLATRQAEAQRRTNRRLRALLVGTAVLALVTFVAAGLAYRQRQAAVNGQREARIQRDQAVSLALAAAAGDVVHQGGALALALAAESSEAAPTQSPEARTALVNAHVAFDSSAAQPIGTPLARGLGFVDDLGFGAGGRFMASVSRGLVRFWDVQRQDRVGRTVPGNAVAFDPAVPDVAAVTRGASTTLWSVTRHQPLAGPFPGEEVAFSPDGRFLAAAAHDGDVWLRDPERGTPVGRRLTITPRPVEAISFSADSRTIAVASGGTVRVWNAVTRNPNPSLRGGPFFGTAIALSPDGSVLAVSERFGAGFGLRLWDVATGRPSGSRLTGHTKPVTSIEFSADGSRLASTDRDLHVSLWDAARGRRIGQPRPGAAAEFTPDGTRLAATWQDGALRMWNARTGEQIGTPLRRAHSLGIYELAIAPNGRVMATGDVSGRVQLWALPAGQSMGTSRQLGQASFTDDGRLLLASTHFGGPATLWKTATGRRVGTGTPRAWAAASRPQEILLATGFRVRRWDRREGRFVGPPLPESFPGLRAWGFDRQGKTLVLFDPHVGGGQVWLWDVATGQKVGPIASQVGTEPAFAFNPAGSVIAVVDGDALKLVDVATGQQQGDTLPTTVGFDPALAFSPDGDVLASADGIDGTSLSLWDVHARKLIRRLGTGHTNRVDDVAFSPDGSLVATSSPDDTVRLWDRRTGDEVGVPLPVPGAHYAGARESGPFPTTVGFAPNGSLTTGGETGTVRFWGRLLDPQLACRLAAPYVTWTQVEPYLPTGWVPACEYQ